MKVNWRTVKRKTQSRVNRDCRGGCAGLYLVEKSSTVAFSSHIEHYKKKNPFYFYNEMEKSREKEIGRCLWVKVFDILFPVTVKRNPKDCL